MTIKETDFPPAMRECLRAEMIMRRMTPVEMIHHIVDNYFSGGDDNRRPRGRFALGVDYIPDAQNQEARLNSLEREVAHIRMALENNHRELMGRPKL